MEDPVWLKYFSFDNLAPIIINLSLSFLIILLWWWIAFSIRFQKECSDNKIKYFKDIHSNIACFQILLFAAPSVSCFQTHFLLSVQSYRLDRRKHSSESSRDFGQASYASLVLSCLFNHNPHHRNGKRKRWRNFDKSFSSFNYLSPEVKDWCIMSNDLI